MGRIFISAGFWSAGYGGLGEATRDLGSVAHLAMAAQEGVLVRDLVLQVLRSRSYDAVAVPDDLNSAQTLDWINSRARMGDIALELGADASDRASRGAVVFYIAQNQQRKSQAEQLLQAYLRRLPQMPSRGVKPDIQTEMGELPFCRQVLLPSLHLVLGSLIDLDDRRLMQTQRQDVALGIAEGLASWSRAVASEMEATKSRLPLEYPAIDLSVNGGAYDDQGVMIAGNAYIPVDLIDQLGIELPQNASVRRVNYRNIVFVRAIDLRNLHVSARLEESRLEQSSNLPMLTVRSAFAISPQQFQRIMGQGHTSDVQMMVFLKSHYADGLSRFPNLPRLYREEATIEGVNYDIAFAQMCVETNFLRFGGSVKPEQNNFAGLGTMIKRDMRGDSSTIDSSTIDSSKDGRSGATFSSARIGVRAQVQHLKAYANTEPFVQAIVDPRFSYVRRGAAPFVNQLSGRWSADLHYHDRVLSVLRRLYESAGFF